MNHVQFLVILATIIGLALHSTEAATAAQWKNRAIYQLLTDRFSGGSGSCSNLNGYCGGTWRGIENRLSYIQNLGFNAIWISPVISNTANGYHGYWAQNFFALNDRFDIYDVYGRNNLLGLVNAAHSRGMYVMLDVVINHVGPVDTTYSSISPFNNADHYHVKCQIEDWMNQTQVEICRLANLPDLKQENSWVTNELNRYITNLVNGYGFDGLRIDTVPEVSKAYLSQFRNAIGNIYALGEVYDGRVDYNSDYARILGATLSYPMFFTLRDVFQRYTSMFEIQTRLQEYSKHLWDTSVLGVFIDNHDHERFLHSQPDVRLYENALTYVLMSTGIPILYYGSEQGFNGGQDPYNREVMWNSFNEGAPLFKFIRTIMTFRNSALNVNSPQVQRYCDDNFYAFTRGNIFVATTNAGSTRAHQQYTITNHPYADGTKLCNRFFLTDCVTVQNGKFDVVLLNGEAKIFYPA